MMEKIPTDWDVFMESEGGRIERIGGPLVATVAVQNMNTDDARRAVRAIIKALNDEFAPKTARFGRVFHGKGGGGGVMTHEAVGPQEAE